MIVKGYKSMNFDMTCRGFKFEVGKTYKHEGEIALCSKGFHFCENMLDVYNYYDKSENTVIVEVEAEDPIKEGDKSVTKSIKIVRILDYKEIFGAWLKNRNSGNYNSGNYNSGNRNSGYFNSTTPKVRLFNVQTDLEFNDPKILILQSLNVKPILSWVETSQMTEDEKTNNPSHKTTGGFLRNTGRMNWSLLTENDKKAITSLPGYDDEIFKSISGISLIDSDVEVTVGGVVKKIKREDAKKLGLID